jgi:hypothetical protein
VRVSATAPVTGAVWATSGFAAGSDFGWFVAADAITAPALVAVAAGRRRRSPSRRQANPQTVVLTAASGTGAKTDIAVPGAVRSRSLCRPVTSTASIRERKCPRVTVCCRGAIAGYPVAPSASAASAVTVYPR